MSAVIRLLNRQSEQYLVVSTEKKEGIQLGLAPNPDNTDHRANFRIKFDSVVAPYSFTLQSLANQEEGFFVGFNGTEVVTRIEETSFRIQEIGHGTGEHTIHEIASGQMHCFSVNADGKVVLEAPNNPLLLCQKWKLYE